jgi:hypothetical protein
MFIDVPKENVLGAVVAKLECFSVFHSVEQILDCIFFHYSIIFNFMGKLTNQ